MTPVGVLGAYPLGVTGVPPGMASPRPDGEVVRVGAHVAWGAATLPPVQFLSDEWRLEALGRLKGDSAFSTQARLAGSLRVWIVAEPRPEWAENITIVIRDAGVEAVAGEDGRPDGTARASYDTWLRLFRGELTPKRAAMTRKLRGKGLPILLRNMGLLNALLEVLRGIPVEDAEAGRG